MVIFHFAAFDKFRNRLRKVLDKFVDAPTRTACGQSLNSRHTSTVCAEPIYTFWLFHDRVVLGAWEGLICHPCMRPLFRIFTFRRIKTSGAGMYGLTTMHAKHFHPRLETLRGWAQYSFPWVPCLCDVTASEMMSFYGISAFPLFISMLCLLCIECARLTHDCRLRTDTHNCVFVCSFLFENVLKRMRAWRKIGHDEMKISLRNVSETEHAWREPRSDPDMHSTRTRKMTGEKWDILWLLLLLGRTVGGWPDREAISARVRCIRGTRAPYSELGNRRRNK